MGDQDQETVQRLKAEGERWLAQGNRAEAARYMALWLRQAPEPVALIDLGNLFKQLGRLEEALAAYAEALRLDPDSLPARLNSGAVLNDLKQYAEAEAISREAIAQQPGFYLAHYHLGHALKGMARGDEAELSYREALRLKPDSALVALDLATLWGELGRADEAEAGYRQALRLQPGYPAALVNLANLLREEGDREEARTCYLDAICREPGLSAAHHNYGDLLYETDRIKEAEACFRLAIHLNPQAAPSYNNLGHLLHDTGRFDEAKACYHQALALNPNYAEAHTNLALTLLRTGDFAAGWTEYEWRWQLKRVAKQARQFREPLWDGRAAGDLTILIHAEQGFGDTIQFCRYLKLAAARAGKNLIFAVQPALLRLLTGLPGVARLVSNEGVLPAFDRHCPLLTLPRILGTDIETIPGEVPYLRVDPSTVAAWRARLAALGPARLTIGIAWAGNPRMLDDRTRSVALQRFMALTELPGIRLVSLQKGDPAKAIAALGLGERIIDWTDELTDFADTAALVAALDLVISVDTAIIHVAGALGKPVWLLNRFNGCWRWLQGRADSPWYPSLRLFHQPQFGDWDGVFRGVEAALRLQLQKGDGVALAQAINDHQAGRVEVAEAAYRRLLAETPDHAECLHLLGVLDFQRGRYETARQQIASAIDQQPGIMLYRLNFGHVLKALGDTQAALASYQAALALAPDNVDCLRVLGNLFGELGWLAEAEAQYRAVLRLAPQSPEVLSNLGNIIKGQGRLTEAEATYRAALAAQPDFAEAETNLGNVLGDLGQVDAALACFRRAIRLKPNLAQAHNNLGNLLREQNELDAAAAACREAIRLKPDYASAHSNLANALRDLNDYAGAETHYRLAIQYDPRFTAAYNNLGTILVELGRLDEAIAQYRQAITLDPHYVDAHHHLAIALLQAGQESEGWQELEWRWRSKRNAAHVRGFTQKLWQGEPIGDRVLLLHGEQGYGDTLQFCRYVPLVAAKYRVILEVQPPLVPLLAGLPGIAQILPRGATLPRFDLHCPLLSLPHALRGQPAPPVPYLSADPVRVRHWRARLAGLPGRKVGLVWAGNPGLAADRRRSLRLAQFQALAEIPGIRFVSLQKGGPADEARTPPAGLTLEDWTAELQDYADTAALVAALDLVISVDTSVAHVAGALGRPVWLLNRFDSCWRWQRNREDSPWYPSLRQFRQPDFGDWASVLTKLRLALRHWIDSDER